DGAAAGRGRAAGRAAAREVDREGGHVPAQGHCGAGGREADLLNPCRGEGARGLLPCVANLFLRFVETPEFNPEAARFLKIPPPPNQQPEVGVGGSLG
ncbi:unnamed protein product, partial [Heterosigma akashiwo]